TSAVHLEFVSRQTTDAFIEAYKRFTGRRGIPEVMYSDNATTFVGASTVLNKLYKQPSRENLQIQAALATNGTQWSFSPPRAPHFGGKWEAAVKSTKYLKRVLGSTTFTYEELNSIMIQIEACLNTRPITKMWSGECLQRYQTIYKWNQRRENIKVGDMVLMVDEEYPPAKWPFGIVVAVHPGDDGLTRVATIKTS
ncbi:uncharacterized protein LOC107046481, partial [Diachasma alloeum]|uniref:uncharacterized protein LOC107046481 n=1 Tax=Diachasma alloeum TaxID=454923 RepID=UPI0007384096